MKSLLRLLLPVADVLLLPFVYPAALVLKAVRRAGVHRLPLSRSALLQVGVFPIRSHYYEPLFDGAELRRPLDAERSLPGIDWNIAGQLELLASFDYNAELADVPREPAGTLTYHLNNSAFQSGDGEFLYNIIRLKKPARLLEVGSGHSTLMARRALAANEREVPGYRCEHVCIEPYEMPWLEQSGVKVLRSRVEEVGKEVFATLGAGDLLFIDSSHMIRPQGDVLFEYLELLPSLRPGVIVHIHDIFSPRDYLRKWVVEEVRFWNEQYLLEAFLSNNRDWKVIGALNMLQHQHYDALRAKCPHLTPEREPVSFYMEKIA